MSTMSTDRLPETLQELVKQGSDQHGDRVALIDADSGEQLTYAQLYEATSSVRGALCDFAFGVLARRYAAQVPDAIPSSDAQSQSNAATAATATATAGAATASLSREVQEMREEQRRSGDAVVAMVGHNSVEGVVAFLGVAAAAATRTDRRPAGASGAACETVQRAPLNAAYSPAEFGFFLRDAAADLLLLILPSCPPCSPSSPSSASASHHFEAARQAAAQLSIPVAVLRRCHRSAHEFVVDFEQSTDPTGATAMAETSGGSDHSGWWSNERSDVHRDDVCLLLHTSGTTSRPKAVPLTHHNLCSSLEHIALTYHLVPSDRSYIVMPLFHVHGLIGMCSRDLLRSAESISSQQCDFG
jgi:acyl-CoA synthetase (AMP-forming)/AMP-acid ligase II